MAHHEPRLEPGDDLAGYVGKSRGASRRSCKATRVSGTACRRRGLNLVNLDTWTVRGRWRGGLAQVGARVPNVVRAGHGAGLRSTTCRADKCLPAFQQFARASVDSNDGYFMDAVSFQREPRRPHVDDHQRPHESLLAC